MTGTSPQPAPGIPVPATTTPPPLSRGDRRSRSRHTYIRTYFRIFSLVGGTDRATSSAELQVIRIRCTGWEGLLPTTGDNPVRGYPPLRLPEGVFLVAPNKMISRG